MEGGFRKLHRPGLAALAVVLLAGCFTNPSGRRDPFVSRIGPLQPGRGTVGIVRFVDTRDPPDLVRRGWRGVPPPRVLLEHAVAAALQRRGVNALILTRPEDASAAGLSAVAGEMALNGTIEGEVIRCEEKLETGFGVAMRAECVLRVVLRDRQGSQIYEGTGRGTGRTDVRRMAHLDEYRVAMNRAIQAAVRDALGDRFVAALRRISGDAGGG